MVDGWGFSLGLGNRITRDYAVAERPISSKCYATSLRLVRGLAAVRDALLEAALMVTARQALFSESVNCADGCRQRRENNSWS